MSVAGAAFVFVLMGRNIKWEIAETFASHWLAMAVLQASATERVALGRFAASHVCLPCRCTARQGTQYAHPMRDIQSIFVTWMLIVTAITSADRHVLGKRVAAWCP